MNRRKRRAASLGSNGHRALSQLREGEVGVLERIALEPEDARRMMELGFVPGAQVTAARSAPGGDPRVYRVDGAEIAMRRETAARLLLRRKPARSESR